MHPLAAVLKQSVRWDTRTSSRISRKQSSGVKMVAVGVAEDDDVVLLFCSLPVLVDDDVVVRGLIWELLLSLLLRFWWAWGDWRVAGVKELWDCWVEFVEVLWGCVLTHCCCCIVCSCVLVSSSSLSSVWPCCFSSGQFLSHPPQLLAQLFVVLLQVSYSRAELFSLLPHCGGWSG